MPSMHVNSILAAAAGAVTLCVELGICIVSMRGSILDTEPRASMHYWLYAKLGKCGHRFSSTDVPTSV